LEVLSRGHLFIPSILYNISPFCNLPVLHLLPISSFTNLYTFDIIVNINLQDVNVPLVTGSPTGIGFETSLLLSRNEFHTYASMRNLEKSRKIANIANRDNLSLQVTQLDVNDGTYVKNAINKIVAENGRIDVLVNNASYGLFALVEDLKLDHIKEQFETNFFGVVRLTKEVLPIVRKQRIGTIVNIISIADKVAISLSSAYVATKYALEGFSDSMRYELK
jgi:short-subunit dehydrogenase